MTGISPTPQARGTVRTLQPDLIHSLPANLMRCLLLLACATLFSRADAADTHAGELLLWPAGAPTVEGVAAEEQPRVYFWPASAEKASGATFVVCPGGGYGGLASDHEGVQVARWLNGIGVSAYVLHYRLGTAGHHFPAQLLDVQRAIRLARHRAAGLGHDPERIGVIGFSAGGHLTSMAATMFDEHHPGGPGDEIDALSARPTVAVPVYPVISMISAQAHQGSRNNLLGPGHTEEQARHVSTDLRVTENTPPVFLFQTDEDTTTPAENAVAFYLACRAKGVPAELHCFEPGRHGVGLALGHHALSAWPPLLERWLRDRGFLKPAARRALQGSVKVNDAPVNWGFLTLSPEDGVSPAASAFIIRGRFKLEEKLGASAGRNRMSLRVTAADLPGATSADGTVVIDRPAPDHEGDWIIDIPPAATSGDSGAFTMELSVKR
jgi:acetyl esterase/lipase